MDDTDSLFEGMVLFNPNSSFLEENEQQQCHDLHTPESTPVGDDAPPPATFDPEPLDESLFSDLTIVTAVDSAAAAEPNPSSYSRQISRKKKRASLRIGYGRDSYSSATADADEVDGEDRPLSVVGEDRSLFVADEVGGEDRPLSVADEVVIVAGDRLAEKDRDQDDQDGLGRRIRERIAEEAEAARRTAEARKAAVAGRRSAAERLREAEGAHAELERRLDEACESEDFEAAERLSDGLAALDAERVSLATALRDAEAECDAVEARMEAALAAQIAAEEECASILDGSSKDASSKAYLVIKMAQEASSIQMEKWNSSTEALELRRMELEIESQIINEARAGLDTSIEHLVEDDKKERESLCKKKNFLVDELQKLLLLVKQKEQEIAETDLNIEAVDERIAGVVSGFQGTQSDIDSKASYLQSGLSEIEAETKDLLTKKKEIDEVLAREEEKGAKLRELANASAEEAKTYLDVVGLRKNLMVSVLKAREDKVKLAKTEEKLSDEVQMLQQVISTSRASLQELSTRKSSLQQDVASSKQKLLFIDKRIPELEAEKKVAAAARNFKEAARIAAEAKSLTVEKDSIQVDAESAVLELEKLVAEIKDTVEKLHEMEVLVSSKQKEVAMARFERLLIIAGSATAERSAALEFGNQEEASLLLAEAEAADAEAKALQPVYDFKAEDFENIPKHFVSMELVARLGKKQLEELAASVQFSPA